MYELIAPILHQVGHPALLAEPPSSYGSGDGDGDGLACPQRDELTGRRHHKLFDKPGERARTIMKRAGYAQRTIDTYVSWMVRFWEFNSRRDPKELGAEHVEAFISHLVSDRQVAASTRNQALAALLLLFRKVLEQDLPWLDNLDRAKQPKKLPVVLTSTEVEALFVQLHGVPLLMAHLLYGGGLRLSECCRLRVMDLDFETNQITVRRGKGGKDRVTILPASVESELRAHLEKMRAQHIRDIADGAGWVELPDAYGRKSPSAGREWRWQWVFPATRSYLHKPTGQRRRHHFHQTTLQRHVGRAVRQSGITKRASTHTLRHSFATHLLEDGVNAPTIKKLMGHKSVTTTMIYLHVMDKAYLGVVSPLDRRARRTAAVPPGVKDEEKGGA